MTTMNKIRIYLIFIIIVNLLYYPIFSVVGEELEPKIVKERGKAEYRVEFFLVSGANEDHVVPADGYFEALAKGERAKRSKSDVVEVEIIPQ